MSIFYTQLDITVSPDICIIASYSSQDHVKELYTYCGSDICPSNEVQCDQELESNFYLRKKITNPPAFKLPDTATGITNT